MPMGFRPFTYHRGVEAQKPITETLVSVTSGHGALSESVDATSAAKSYVRQMFAAEAAPDFTAPVMGDAVSDLRPLSCESVPLTNSTVVKFRQIFNKVPVYGSLITVELDHDLDLLALNSSLGTPANVDCVATISPARALEIVRQHGGRTDTVPRPVIYKAAEAWRLVYLLKDVAVDLKPVADHEAAPLQDFMVDAHDGSLVAALPRALTAGAPGFRTSGTPPRLHDPQYNLHTHDFAFGDVGLDIFKLPGAYCPYPPNLSVGVEAHRNSTIVMDFLRDVLLRRGLDNADGPLVSSVNCVRFASGDTRIWDNAMWIRGQAIYGQRQVQDRLVSLAESLEIVAHEIIHGVTEATARLEGKGEPGALNESYSDILAIIIVNRDLPVDRWDWQFDKLTATGKPSRRLDAPETGGQPAHMNHFVPKGDVHTNSGIHNKAAHLLISAKAGTGAALFDATGAAAIFYLALSQHLTRNSTFSDSRRALELACRSYFRKDGQPAVDERVAAVAKAFDAVGIA